jgi:hypothetical protein
MVSPKPPVYDRVLSELSSAPSGIRCLQLERLLDDLGFKVRRGRLGGHRAFTHPGLADFRGGNFDGGHRSTAFVKSVYVQKILRICKDYEEELREFLEKRIG